MIKSFRHKGLKALYEDDSAKGVNQDHVKRLKKILAILDEADSFEDLSIPSLRLHELKGKREGTWAVDVNGPWRVTFSHEERGFCDVDYEQYH